MKNLVLLFFGLLLFQNFAFGQIDESRNFLYLYTDSVIYVKTIDYKKPLIGGAYFITDSRRIKPELVKFYSNEKGFFANTQHLNYSGIPTFTERIRKGRINLYETETINYNHGSYSAGTGMPMGGSTSKSIKNYYNIGFGELKKANYTNLSADLGEEPGSLAHLTKYKSDTKIQTILYVVGGAAIIGGIISFANTPMPKPNENNSDADMTLPFLGLGIGGGSFLVSYFISLSKPNHLRNAIDVYNR